LQEEVQNYEQFSRAKLELFTYRQNRIEFDKAAVMVRDEMIFDIMEELLLYGVLRSILLENKISEMADKKIPFNQACLIVTQGLI
jgi:hypothetical protein